MVNRRGFLFGLLGAFGLGSICGKAKSQEITSQFKVIERSRWRKAEITEEGKIQFESGGWVRFGREMDFGEVSRGIRSQYYPCPSGFRICKGSISSSVYEKNLWFWKLAEEEITPV